MKYPANIYAKAFVEALVGASGARAEAIGKNFLTLVQKNGDESHLKKILDEAERFARTKGGMRKVTIESARPVHKSSQAIVKQLIKPGDVLEEKVNPELIAGIRVIINEEMQLDGSLKGKLDKIFGNI